MCLIGSVQVPDIEEQRRVTIYMESTESLVPTRIFDLNSIYLLHSILYRNYTDIVASSESPLQATLQELGNMPEQVPDEQNKLVTLRLLVSG